jgi:HEAT repeat protein
MAEPQAPAKRRSRPNPLLAHLAPETDEEWTAASKAITKATNRQLIEALVHSRSANIRWAICYRLGRRCVPEAVPALIECLNDPDPDICAEAAEALGNIGDARAGPALHARLADPTGCDQLLLLFAVGSVGYRPAIPDLLHTLSEPGDLNLRAYAALSLASLGAVEALPLMQVALEETDADSSLRQLIERSIYALAFAAEILAAGDVGGLSPEIEEALEHFDPLLNDATIWALRTVGGEDVRRLLSNRLDGLRGLPNYCPLRHRIMDALSALDETP